MKIKTASAWAFIAIALTIASCTKQDVSPKKSTPPEIMVSDSDGFKPPKDCCHF
jgi:hypothetical protein